LRLPVLTVDRLTAFTDDRRRSVVRGQGSVVLHDGQRTTDDGHGKRIRSPRSIQEACSRRDADLGQNLARSLNLPFTDIPRSAGRTTAGRAFVGGYTRGVTPVPIPNTAVKPAGPMILRQRESRSPPALIPSNPSSVRTVEGLLVCAGGMSQACCSGRASGGSR
jgi:hypothetical protein